MTDYKIYIDNILIGTTKLESADPPMGVVFGTINPILKFDYVTLKELCKTKAIKIETDYAEDQYLSTISSEVVRVVNSQQIEINGMGNQISGSDQYGYEISILGIAYPFYEEEFPHHVKEYKSWVK